MTTKTIKAAVFNTRTRPVPIAQWADLVALTDGQDLTNILERWGAEPKTSPVITILVTVLEASKRIRGSRFIIRGPTFKVPTNHMINASTIWPALSALDWDQDILKVSFTVHGEALNFQNREARNFSLWADLRGLPNFRIFKGDTALSPEEADNYEAIKAGALFRVSVSPLTESHMAIRLFVVPIDNNTIKEVARTWNISSESAEFPAIEITNHWR